MEYYAPSVFTDETELPQLLKKTKKEMEKIARRLLGKGFSSRLVFEILSGLEESSRLDD